MKTILNVFACLTLAASAALADSKIFREIVGDAAKIQQDAAAIHSQLRLKNPDFDAVRSKTEALNSDIEALRKDVEAFEANHPNLTEAQKKDWELLKTKVQLLMIFADQKKELLNSGDVRKNRTMLRAHAQGIAKRAEMLQQTASRLDR
jgi:uncharacterized protein (DUF3084 family)